MALCVMRAFCRNMLCKLVFILMKNAYGMLLYREDAEGDTFNYLPKSLNYSKN